MAAFNGNVDAVRALIAAGASVNHPDENQHTPLHHAVISIATRARKLPAGEKGQAAIVRALVEAGAKLTKAVEGKTALQFAEQRGLRLIVNAIKEQRQG